MSLFDWIKPINKGIEIVDQFVVDKDRRNELRGILEQLKEKTEQMREESHQIALQTVTVPWIDGLHKMGRQLLSLVTLAVGAGLLYAKPDIDPMALATVCAPGGIYNLVKGRGK